MRCVSNLYVDGTDSDLWALLLVFRVNYNLVLLGLSKLDLNKYFISTFVVFGSLIHHFTEPPTFHPLIILVVEHVSRAQQVSHSIKHLLCIRTYPKTPNIHPPLFRPAQLSSRETYHFRYIFLGILRDAFICVCVRVFCLCMS